VNLCRGLQDRGHRITVVGEDRDPELVPEFEFVRVPVDRSSSGSELRSYAENAPRAARDLGADLVLGLGLIPDVDVVRVTGRIPVPHGEPGHAGLRGRLERWNPRIRALLELERRTFGERATARHFVVPSRIERRLLAEHYGIEAERTTVVYHGVDRDLFHPGWRVDADRLRAEHGIAPETPLLTFAATSDYKAKGLHATLAALRRTTRRDVSLLVLGDGPMRREESLVRRWGLRKRVVFAGRRADVQRFYAASDLFVLPTEYEPMPHALLEALACGTPVLTTRTCAAAEIVVPGVNGYLVDDARSLDQLAATVDEHFERSEGLRRAMSERCVATANRLTVGANAARIESILHGVCDERPATIPIMPYLANPVRAGRRAA
jgi:UDP-glucose:(heptosyl)LPS alpha-1,3-glucosyltransferase